MKKLSLNLMLSGCLFLNTLLPANVQAATVTETKATVTSESRVADVFDRFRYEMTVEWDQRDPNFKEAAQKELEVALMGLQAEGVTNEAIVAYMEKSILDENSKKEYRDLLVTMEKQNLDDETAAAVAMNFMSKKYQQGLGFSSGGSRSYRKLLVIVGVLIVGVVTYMVIKHHKKKKKNDDGCKDECCSCNDCPEDEDKDKGNNGHGNNDDGVDVSNPGNGNGGPNGEEDPSGDVDDEGHGGGSIISHNH